MTVRNCFAWAVLLAAGLPGSGSARSAVGAEGSVQVAAQESGPGSSPEPAPGWALGPFTRPTDTVVIQPRRESVFADPIRRGPVHWEALHTFNPAAVVRNGKVVVLYRAEDDSGAMAIGGHTSRLGMAESGDGIHFARRAEPVFFPADDEQKSREWPGGVEDPRLVEAPDGSYVLTYTQWNRTSYTIGIATSPDLIHWTKRGPAFGKDGVYGKLMYKSGGIVTRLEGGRLVAAKIHGKFWMYWGEVQVRVASSPDLVHWTPVEQFPGKPLVLLEHRAGSFDSEFPETGPPAVLTSRGIVLLYNGKNAVDAKSADAQLGGGAYAVGQALFSADDPARLLQRLDKPSLFPEKDFERTGQYAAGTTFGEGLVAFRGKWFLYYGCADSFVAVATAPVAVESKR